MKNYRNRVDEGIDTGELKKKGVEYRRLFPPLIMDEEVWANNARPRICFIPSFSF